MPRSDMAARSLQNSRLFQSAALVQLIGRDVQFISRTRLLCTISHDCNSVGRNERCRQILTGRRSNRSRPARPGAQRSTAAVGHDLALDLPDQLRGVVIEVEVMAGEDLHAEL